VVEELSAVVEVSPVAVLEPPLAAAVVEVSPSIVLEPPPAGVVVEEASAVVEVSASAVVVEVSPTAVLEPPPAAVVVEELSAVVEVSLVAVVEPPLAAAVLEPPPAAPPGSCADAMGASAARTASATSVARAPSHKRRRRSWPSSPTLSASFRITPPAQGRSRHGEGPPSRRRGRRK
jgi:hypothetical protein